LREIHNLDYLIIYFIDLYCFFKKQNLNPILKNPYLLMIYTKNLFRFNYIVKIPFKEYVSKSIDYSKNYTSVFNSSDKSVTEFLMNS